MKLLALTTLLLFLAGCASQPYWIKFHGLTIGLILQYIWPVQSPAALAVDAASLLLTFVAVNYLTAWILKVLRRHGASC